MGIPGNIGSSGTSSVGGDLVKSLLDSATLSPALDDNPASLGLVRELKASAAADPFSVELDRLSKKELEKGNNASQSQQDSAHPTNPTGSTFDQPLLFNPPPHLASLPYLSPNSKSKTNNSTPDKDLLTGSTSNTPLVSFTANDPVTNAASSLKTKANIEPKITAALVNDTASAGTNTDGITSDPTIAGRITGTDRIKKFQAGFDNTPKGKYLNVLPYLKSDSSFTFDRATLEQINGGTLSDGFHALHLWVQDERGNSHKLLLDVNFTLDTIAPTTPPSLALLAASDSGASNSDKITNNSTPTILGTAVSGHLVQLFSNGQLVGQTSSDENGSWQITTTPLTEGTQTLTAKAVDVAGNASPVSVPLNVVIDTIAPTVPSSLKLSGATDTGISNSDGITKNPTPSLSGQAEAGASVRVFKDGLLVGQATATDNSSWQLAIDSLADGSYTFNATAEDKAGNVSNLSQPLAVTIDTTAPAAPNDLDLMATSDSGSSNTDNITNNSTPTIAGTTAPGNLVQLFSNGQLVGQTTATATNTWLLATNNLADGIHTLTAIATDVAGNISPTSASLDVVIDTTAPAAPSNLRLTPSTDTGTSNSDNITNNTTPTIQGTGEAASLIRLFKGEQVVGQTTASTDGSWQISVATSLSDGLYTFTAKAEDAAGNASTTSGQLVVTIDTRTDNSTLTLANLYGLDPYPDAVSLVPGITRQLSVKLNDGLPDSPNLTAGSTGTRYIVSNSDVLSVSADGLITALSTGFATVTVTYGEAEVVVPVRVETPQFGPVTLGVDGGVVQASNGSMVMIAPGALEENTTVSLTPLGRENITLSVPEGFELVGAFDLNFGDDLLSVAAQLAIPAPAGLAVGTQVYFMRKGALPDENGTWNPIWLQEESGVVGADGMIRTQSPPYPGVLRPGEYIVVADGTGSAMLVKGKLTVNYNLPIAYLGVVVPAISPGGGVFGQLMNPDNLVALSAFSATYDISSVKVIAVPTVGLPFVTTVGVQRNANGVATFEATLNIPAPTGPNPTRPPILQKAELKFKDENNQPFENNEPVLFLTGSNVLVNNAGNPLGSRIEDLSVKFYVGDEAYGGVVLPHLSRELGNNKFEVAVKVPNTVPLGVSTIELSRRQNKLVGQDRTDPVYEEVNYSSNTIRLKSEGKYVFAAMLLDDRVTVLNGSNPESVVEANRSSDLLLARIPVGTPDLQDRPRDLAVTRDGSRVYVPLEGTGRVALVDPMVLQQVDTQPLSFGIDPINLPQGASPRSIAISLEDDYAYIADGNQGKIYVLDINPFSETYHQVTQTILVNPAPSGLRQISISSDGRKLFVTAPSSSNSQILVVNIDPEDQPIIPEENPRKWHEQIGAVVADSGAEGLAATSNPLVMTFTNSRSDAKGFGMLGITNEDPLSFAATTRYTSLGLGSTFDYFDVNNGVAVTVMRDLSYAFVVGRNGINFGLGVESIDGVRAGSNIGIIKDPLTNPQLIAATRPIPGGFATDLVLSSDNKYLYASYSGAGSVFVFDVEEIINTIQNPGNYAIDQLDRGAGSPFFQSQSQRSATFDDFRRVPIDDINPSISIAADYEILRENRPANQFTYGVPADTTRGPIGTGIAHGLAISSGMILTAREEVQEISKKIARKLRNLELPNLPDDEREQLEEEIAQLQRQRRLPLEEVVREAQPDADIDDSDRDKGIYAIALGQSLQIFYGTSFVIWNLAPVSESVDTIREDIASKPDNLQLPPVVNIDTLLGLGGSGIQGRVQPYPGDIDFSERFEIEAPTSESAARAAADTIVEFVRRTRNNPNFEFQKLYISTLEDGRVENRPKRTLSFDELVSGSKYDKLVAALQKLDPVTRGKGNVNTFWRAKVDGDRFIDITKILNITAKNSTGEEVFFSTRETIWDEDLLLSQVISEEDNFFSTRISGAEYQSAYFDNPREIPAEKLSAYTKIIREAALDLTDGRNPKYLKAAKRAFNYFLAIGNIAAMEAVQPIFVRPEARVNQEVAVMEAIKSALDDDPIDGFQTRILTVVEARTMLNNAAQTIEDSLSAANIAAQLRQLATDLPGNPSDLLPQDQDGTLSTTLAGLIKETKNLINNGLQEDVRRIINTYVRPYYQGLAPLP
ncbi:hypothetical protein C7Y66_21110 [Chroococcidiopsis sp. CCALA 051]|uniref:Ig-like domain-containing protein n=1 Tax=Chroococcidiopsis sp. CCALA 051 TaxID=869949 RepID=UPI000D0CCFF8|nr:Ig-like domain-containing protein [Chroococcidiopsis sp. CCALA 051]PSM47179.1 hypothetical protein C7Y66_21110 [Chroococcidiopsis sp. CCALA 051]